MFDAELCINETNIVDESFEWQTSTFDCKINEAIKEAEAESVSLQRVKHPAEVTDEVFQALAKIKKSERGLQSLTFSFLKLEEKVNEAVLDQFMQGCKHLKELSIRCEEYLPETDRQNVLEIASKILEDQAEPEIKKLILTKLGDVDEPNRELAVSLRRSVTKTQTSNFFAADKRLITAIVRSAYVQLTDLDLSHNPQWWDNSEAAEHLLGFIKEQVCLEVLVLSDSEMNCAQTSQLLTTLLESKALTTLKRFFFVRSGDFQTKECCTLLAQFIDKAPLLTNCDLDEQVGMRKVKVELKIGDNGKEGSIKVIDQLTKQAFVQIPTKRTTKVIF